MPDRDPSLPLSYLSERLTDVAELVKLTPDQPVVITQPALGPEATKEWTGIEAHQILGMVHTPVQSPFRSAYYDEGPRSWAHYYLLQFVGNAPSDDAESLDPVVVVTEDDMRRLLGANRVADQPAAAEATASRVREWLARRIGRLAAPALAQRDRRPDIRALLRPVDLRTKLEGRFLIAVDPDGPAVTITAGGDTEPVLVEYVR